MLYHVRGKKDKYLLIKNKKQTNNFNYLLNTVAFVLKFFKNISLKSFTYNVNYYF